MSTANRPLTFTTQKEGGKRIDKTNNGIYLIVRYGVASASCRIGSRFGNTVKRQRRSADGRPGIVEVLAKY